MHNLNYKHLKYFWLVAREGSIAEACEQLHLTPQTISGQLSQLEEALGIKLFKKKGRRLQITEDGMTVLRYANDIFELGSELESVIKREISTPAPTLLVGVADAVPKLIACQILSPVLNLEDKVRLTCFEGRMDALLADLAIHKLDIVLADAPIPPKLSVRAFNHLLGECGTSFFVSDKFRNKLNPFPEVLDDTPILVPSRNSAFRSELEGWFNQSKLNPMIAAEFDDSALLKAFGQAGFGVFTAPSAIEHEIVRQYQVKVIGRVNELNHQYYAISTDKKLTHPAIIAICKKARENLFN